MYEIILMFLFLAVVGILLIYASTPRDLTREFKESNAKIRRDMLDTIVWHRGNRWPVATWLEVLGCEHHEEFAEWAKTKGIEPNETVDFPRFLSLTESYMTDSPIERSE